MSRAWLFLPLLIPVVAGVLIFILAPRLPVTSQEGWVQGGPYRLATRSAWSARLGNRPVLVVALHGDAPFERPSYHYVFADRIAGREDDVVAVGLLRPGYTDTQGRTSGGERGKTGGHNWHADNTDSLAAAIRVLRELHQPRRVVVAGHSGGAALTANMLGRHPGLIDAALLVSLPGDLDRWRRHMYERTGAQLFREPVSTLSPCDQLAGIPRDARITLVVGRRDDITPPELSALFQDEARKRGLKIERIELPGKGHDIFLEPAVLQALSPLLR